MFHTLIGILLILLGVVGLADITLHPLGSFETLFVSGYHWVILWFGIYCLVTGYREK